MSERTSRITIFLLACVVIAAIALLYAIVPKADASNKAAASNTSLPSIPLPNPDFEEGFAPYNGIGELKVGTHWHPDWREDREEGLIRPEYIPHRTSELLDPDGSTPIPGDWSQKVFVTFAKMDSWLRQDIEVIPNAWYKVSAWVYMRSQDNKGDISAMVCINPWGNWNAADRTTICGREVTRVYGKWMEVQVIAPSFGSRISIFLRGVNKWPVRWNDLYWDQVRMEKVEMGGVCPTPVPCPTRVPGTGDCATVREIEQLLRGMRWEVQ